MAKLSKKLASAQANAGPTKASSLVKVNSDTGKTVKTPPRWSALNWLLRKGKTKEKEQERERERETNGWVQIRPQQKTLAERPQRSGPSPATQLTSIDESGEVENNPLNNGFFKSSLEVRKRC